MSVHAPSGIALTVRATAVTHPGRVRKRNEDAVAVGGWMPATYSAAVADLTATPERPVLAIVADGAGGHPAGDVASWLTVRHLAARARTVASPAALSDAIAEAHAALRRQGQEHPEQAGLGSTVAAVCLTPEAVIVGNVGDSRIYELIDGEPVQLSTDDNPQRPDFIDESRTTSSLTQMLGGDAAEVSPHVARYDSGDGLDFLICTDGLSACVPEPELADAIRERDPRASLAGLLLQRALAAGAPDNVTIVHLHTQIQGSPR